MKNFREFKRDLDELVNLAKKNGTTIITARQNPTPTIKRLK